MRVPLFFCVLLNSFFLLIYLKLRPTRIRDYGMKKILLAIIVFAFSSGIYAQTHEFGVVVGAKSGLSHKFKIENFAVQTDLLAGSICTVIEDWGDFYTSDIFQFTLNCNLLYNKDYTNGIYFFAGAGPNIGLTSSPSIFTYEDEVTALGKIEKQLKEQAGATEDVTKAIEDLQKDIASIAKAVEDGSKSEADALKDINSALSTANGYLKTISKK